MELINKLLDKYKSNKHLTIKEILEEELIKIHPDPDLSILDANISKLDNSEILAKIFE